MLKWIVAAVLAVMALPAQALVGIMIVGDGSYITRDARGNVISDRSVTIKNTFFGESWDSKFWLDQGNPFGSCDLYRQPGVAPCIAINRSGNVLTFSGDPFPGGYTSFWVRLVFDRDIESDPDALTEAAFLSGTYSSGYAHHSGSASYSGTVSYVAGVPEAATWLLLISGFGLVGIALRRRSYAALAAKNAERACHFLS
jgi:hypothetical protein